MAPFLARRCGELSRPGVALVVGLLLGGGWAAGEVAMTDDPAGALADLSGPEAESGITLEYLSASVSPGEDFFLYANQGWLDTTDIPEDQSNYGSFGVLDELVKENIAALIAEVSQAADGASRAAQQVGAFYQSHQAVEVRNALGLGPIQPLLDRVASVQTLADAAPVAAELSRLGVPFWVAYYVSPDARQSDRYAVYIQQAGTRLPDRDYYLQDEARYQQIRDAYREYMSDLLVLGGFAAEESAAVAAGVLDLERRLAEAQWTRTQMRDPVKSYNPMEFGDVARQLAALDWQRYAEGVGLPTEGRVIVRQPDFIQQADVILSQTPPPVLRAWMTVAVIDTFAPYLDQSLELRHFQFHQQTLAGVAQQKPLWRRGVELCNAVLGMPVGQLYVERHFPPEAKARMEQLVENLKLAFAQRLERLDWMGQSTRQEALQKLSLITTKIGYPDRWKDYASVEIRPDDLIGNLQRLASFEHDYELRRLGQPVDRQEWYMSPQTVNAYYSPLQNEIVFPAGILQPPFFNLKADDAVNYGAIGAVIGHELSHGFDDSGSQFDGRGNLRNWWSATDREEFQRRSRALVEQYNQYRPFEDMRINGELTLGENIGDLGGLNIALSAYQLSLAGAEPPVLDGFTGEQRFFLGWSQIWRRKYREQELRRRLLTDPHSPSRYRVIGIVANIDAFYAAFGVEPGEAMYIPPEQRVRIW
jgi:putative endopeptidase